MRGRFFQRAFEGGHLQLEVHNVEWSVHDQRFQLHEEAFFTELSGNMKRHTRSGGSHSVFGLGARFLRVEPPVLGGGLLANDGQNLMLALDLLYELSVRKSDGLSRADIGAGGAANHAVVLACRLRLVIMHVIDPSATGDEAQLAADAVVVIDRGELRDGFTGDAVPEDEFR